MSEEIIVYWNNEVSILSPFIVPALQEVSMFAKSMAEGDNNRSSDIKKCPSIINLYRNTFAVKSAINFDIAWTGEEFSSKKLDVNNTNFVNQRDKKVGLVSVMTPANITMMTEEPSLKVEFRNATYGRNDFCNKAVLIEGEIDIGKWYRPSDLAFFFRNKKESIDVKAGDSLYYIKFKTERKVIFKRYQLTTELFRIRKELLDFRDDISEIYGASKDKLENYYQAFDNSLYKKRIIQEIKNNLME